MIFDATTPIVAADYRCYNTFADQLFRFNFPRFDPFNDPDTGVCTMGL